MDALITLLSNTVFGASVTLCASIVAGYMIQRRPKDRSWWEEAKEKPGLIIAGATFSSNLAAALPRVVWEPGEFICDASGCTVVGGGQRVVEGTGFGAFLGDLVVSALVDVPIVAVGLALGASVARASQRTPAADSPDK